jgi:hypothetical protein
MKTASTHSDGQAKNACRDRELVHYVGRFGIVSVGHVMAAMEVGRAVTYKRVSRCIEMGLLERHEVLRTEPSILRATRAGLTYAGLGLPVAQFSPGTVEHDLRCASVALQIAGRVGLGLIASEREIALVEQEMGKPFASAAVAPLPTGKFRYHRADLSVRCDGEFHAVEVELTAKAPRRLEEIINGWHRCEDVDCVVYYCREGKTRRGVERAIARVGAGEKVLVRTLEEA